MAERGRLIVLEGGEGSGKDANIALLKDDLKHRENICFTREPGGTAVGEAVRRVLLSADHGHMVPESELLLFLACRAQLVEEVIRPALVSGIHVISNRFALSTYAYQIARTQRRDLEPLLTNVSTQIAHDLEPFYILLDIPPEIGLVRARGRDEASSRFDLEAHDVHVRVRAGYLEAVRAYSHVIVDASRPMAEVYADVRKEVEQCIGL